MSAYADYIVDLLSSWGPASSRRMFGGHGIFRSGLMFALIADDQLYLKSDSEADDAYLEAGSEQFTYRAKGKAINLSYWSAPEVFFEEPDELVKWADTAFNAALRADEKKPKKKQNKQLEK